MALSEEVTYGCESWTIKKAESQRTLETARRSNQSILKEINLEYLLEGLMLKLKLQFFGYLIQSQLFGKDHASGKD